MTAASPRIAIGPDPVPGWIRDAFVAGGGVEAPVGAADALVWCDPRRVEPLQDALAAAGPDLRWVQLPFAGVERHLAAGIFDDGRLWTCGKGVYAEPVAELALAMGLYGLRNLHAYGPATSWTRPAGTSLYDGRVTIFGAGGITESLMALLAPFRAEVTVVRRRPEPVAGAARTLALEQRREAVEGADLVVLALALTPETRGTIGAAELEAMAPHAWLVNVARGPHVVTDDLVRALQSGAIGGAALDVTDPEPLPDGHPLWHLPTCLITPHTANTPEMAQPLLARRIRENVARFAAGEPLLGPVDPAAGY